MKLEDIKKAIVHAALGELKRSLYNACGCVSENVIRTTLETELNMIYEAANSQGEVTPD